jgi:hypothetical protein
MESINIRRIREDFLAEWIKKWMKFQVIPQRGSIEKGVMGIEEVCFWLDDTIIVLAVDGNTIRFCVLRKDGTYLESDDGSVVKNFDFHSLIFVQRFKNFTNLAKIVDWVTTWVNGIIN